MKKTAFMLLVLSLLTMTACASPIEFLKTGDPASCFDESDKLLTIRFLKTETMSDCFYLTYDGMTMLIDCSTANEAQVNLVPHMRELGVEKIDCVVSTHPHNDHAEGFSSFAASFPIGALYTCFPLDCNQIQKQMVETAEANDIPVIRLNNEDSIPFSDLSIQTYSDEEKEGCNCASMVIYIRFGNSKLMLLADTEAIAQKRLNVLWNGDVKCDILKMPHHGNNTPSYSFMLNAQPRLAVITNRYTKQCADAITSAHNVGCGDILFTFNADIVCATDGNRWVIRQDW